MRLPVDVIECVAGDRARDGSWPRALATHVTATCNGHPRTTSVAENMDKAGVDREELLSAASMTQAIQRMDEIKHATVENDGKISIVPSNTSR